METCKTANNATKTTKSSLSCAFAPASSSRGGLLIVAALGGGLLIRRPALRVPAAAEPKEVRFDDASG